MFLYVSVKYQQYSVVDCKIRKELIEKRVHICHIVVLAAVVTEGQAVTRSSCHPVTLPPCHPVTLSPCHTPCHLEYSEQGAGDGVEVGGGAPLGEVEVPAKELHAEQGEDEDEEEEE